MRNKLEIKRYHERFFGVREQILKPWSKVMNAIKSGDQVVAAKYTDDIRDTVEHWIVISSGTVRSLGWACGEESFMEAMTPTIPDFVNGLRLPWWVEKYSTPEGDMPPELLNQTYPSRQLQKKEHVMFIYRHTVQVHSHIFNINKLHPGKWHPDFQNRIINVMLFYEGIIRSLGWVLKKKPEGQAFYAFADQVIDQLQKALKARQPVDIGILPVRQSLPVKDHDRSEFEN